VGPAAGLIASFLGPGQPVFQAFASEKERFLFNVFDAQITFQRDGLGNVTGMIFRGGSEDLPAPRKMVLSPKQPDENIPYWLCLKGPLLEHLSLCDQRKRIPRN
jgi:hypothetical protein